MTHWSGQRIEGGNVKMAPIKEMVSSRKFSPHIQGTHDDFCAIKFYREFATHQLEKMHSPESLFFLAIGYKVNPLPRQGMVQKPTIRKK